MLIRCSNVFGGCQVDDGVPELFVRSNLVVRDHALYDRNRALVPASALMREHGSLAFPGNSVTSTHNPYRPKRIVEEPVYWIGQFHTHFGHFLVSTLPRLWAKADHPIRIGYTGHVTAEAIFSVPFANVIFRALNLTPADFLHLHNFDQLRDVVVPGNGFLENSIAYSTFRTLNHAIAQRLSTPSFGARADDRPIYFSKARLKAGVSRVRNESDMTDRLERAGVRIVYPEELSFPAQINLWNSGSLFAGYAGSALHLAAFAQKKKIISLNHSRHAESNQILIDMMCDHHAAYLEPAGGMDLVSPGPGFHREVVIRDPASIAEGLLRAFDRMHRDPDGLCMRPRPIGDTVSRVLFMNEPFGANVARNKPARISSTDPTWQVEDAERDAQRVVSGMVSERYQFHTLNEPSPWWDVDLCRRHLVNEIRIFNRHDVAHWRAARLLILVSDDGEAWEQVHQRTDAGDFDGFDTDPYRWQPEQPLLTRHVRIQLPTHDMLHLNQVEIFGYPAEHAAI